MSLLIVTVDVSQWLVEPATAFGSVGVNVARHEIVVLGCSDGGVVGRRTAAVVSVNVASTVPVQLPLSYSVNITVRYRRSAAVVTVAVSFGSQFCAVVMPTCPSP